MTDRDADTTRARIIEAAGEIFAERGFQAATVREICQAAGANVAAINYYFGDKQRLYIEAVVVAHRWRMEQAAMPEWPSGTPATQRLADFVTTFILRIRSGPGDTWHTRLMMRELTQPDAACAAVVRDSIRPQFEILVAIVRELMPDDTSEEALHLTAFSVVGQCLFYHLADPVVRSLIDADEYNAYDVDKLARHITRFALAGIHSRSETHSAQPHRATQRRASSP